MVAVEILQKKSNITEEDGDHNTKPDSDNRVMWSYN